MNEQQINAIVESVLARVGPHTQPAEAIPVEPSARHVHLTAEALQALFGPGAALTQSRGLSQPGEFLSEQRVHIVTAQGMLERVAVLGPVRSAVQAELSLTDCHALGLEAPVRLSGDFRGAADVTLVGPAGIYEAKGAAIVAQRHIHMTPEDAARLQVQDGQAVCVRVRSMRPVQFEDVIVRVSKHFTLAMHIDFDEANACGLRPCDVGEMEGIRNSEFGIRNDSTPEPCESLPATMIGDKVITETTAKQLAKTLAESCGKPQRIITMRRGTILTPSARDVFSDKKIVIEWL